MKYRTKLKKKKNKHKIDVRSFIAFITYPALVIFKNEQKRLKKKRIDEDTRTQTPHTPPR